MQKYYFLFLNVVFFTIFFYNYFDYERGVMVMNEILSILIIEDDVTACRELKECIEQHEELELVEITNNAHNALLLVRSHIPNVILLDLELHRGGGNGFIFLNELAKMNLDHPPYILVTTNNMSEVTLEQAKELGADFTLTKYEDGYCAEYVIENILLMRNAIRRKNSTIMPLPDMTPAQAEQLLIKRIQRELDLVGVSTKLLGYNYLVDAILLTIQGHVGNLARILAPKYAKSEKSIERAMQSAIKQTWQSADIDDLLHYYTAKVRPERGCPTLMEFVSYYAMRIKNEKDLED